MKSISGSASYLNFHQNYSSIYHIRKDMRRNPYCSISVVWMELERNPKSWFYSYDQMDNLCSPWDLYLSQYVLPENVRALPIPKSLSMAHASAKAVLLHLEGYVGGACIAIVFAFRNLPLPNSLLFNWFHPSATFSIFKIRFLVGFQV